MVAVEQVDHNDLVLMKYNEQKRRTRDKIFEKKREEKRKA
jgi:hypothetical protein